MNSGDYDRFGDLIKEHRTFINPTFDASDDDFQFSKEIGYAARVIAEESDALQQGKINRSSELIGYATVMSRDTLHLRGSVLSPEIGVLIAIPSDFQGNKLLPKDNQYVKCDVTWEKQTVEHSIPKEGTAHYQQVYRFSNVYRPVLDNWQYLDRKKIFEYPFKPEEFKNMVWTSLDADMGKTDTEFNLDLLQNFMLSSAISSPPVHNEQGGLLSQVLAPSEIQSQTTQLLRKLHKLFPDYQLTIPHPEYPKKMTYFTYDHETKLNKSVRYLQSRNSLRFDEHSMDLRYDHSSQITFNGELNMVMPMSLSISRSDEKLRKYGDYIELYSFIAKTNAPAMEMSTKMSDYIQDQLQSTLFRNLEGLKDYEKKYIGKGHLIDPDVITQQLQRLLLSESRKQGRLEVDKGMVNYLIHEFDKLVRYTISEIEQSTMQRALKTDRVKTTSYSTDQNIILQTYLSIENSYPHVLESMLLVEAERTSSLSRYEVEQAYQQLRDGGVFMRSQNEQKDWVVKRL